MDTQLDRDIAGMQAAEQRLLARTAALTDREVLLPSRLPDWTVGHVLTHIARNGDSVARRLEGSARGEIVDQYPGGAAQRAAEIDDGAGRTSAELWSDLVAVQERVDTAIGCLHDDAWDAVSRDSSGRLRPARDLIAPRWREIEVHHVDLGLGYEPVDWPQDFVARLLPQAMEGVGARLPGVDALPPETLLAWVFGRAEPPGLPRLLPF